VHHVIVGDPRRQLREQDVVFHVVEVGAKIKIDDASLAFLDRFFHPVHRFMCRPPRSVPERSRLEVGLEDRFQDEHERTLDHAVADCGDAEHADFLAAVLRDFFWLGMGTYLRETSSTRICSRKASAPLSSMAAKVTPSIPGAPSFFLASA